MHVTWNRDKAQIEVIESPVKDRILVDAGPGTGKTAVACARVAWMIDEAGVMPRNIWVISFTRTAVQEIRNRIQSFLKKDADAYSVRIATLDSHAWKIHSGFDINTDLLGSYDENIESLTNKIRDDRDGRISQYLKTVEHFIVDEAQDIVGIRAELVLQIIEKLSDRCGVTVFYDGAQAIYGFSIDEENRNNGVRQKTLPEKIVSHFNGNFRPLHLVKVFRTQSPTLNQLFTVTRQAVMEPAEDPRMKLCSISSDIRELADNSQVPRISDNVDFPDDCFILFRRRAEVLLAASFMRTRPHRIRMSGLPQCIQPWVGACLSEHTRPRVTLTEFEDYWDDRVESTPLGNGIDSESAWKQLVRLAGTSNTVVDMRDLKQRLGTGKPPAEFCTPEIGTSGPIIGTIHASKGREADSVNLMMPAGPDDNSPDAVNYDEETRVIFVGATRARKWLGVGEGYNYHFARKLDSGRVYRIPPDRDGRAMVEIGREYDITAMGVAGRSYYSDAETVSTNQDRLYCFAEGISNARAVADHECGHIYRVIPDENKDDGEGDIAVLSQSSLTSDLFKIGKKISNNKRRPPNALNHLRIYGLRTIVLPPDSPETGHLHEPWSRSGIMLAPVLLGYPTGFFPHYH